MAVATGKAQKGMAGGGGIALKTNATRFYAKIFWQIFVYCLRALALRLEQGRLFRRNIA
jgi:hypothetical protein